MCPARTTHPNGLWDQGKGFLDPGTSQQFAITIDLVRMPNIGVGAVDRAVCSSDMPRPRRSDRMKMSRRLRVTVGPLQRDVDDDARARTTPRSPVR